MYIFQFISRNIDYEIILFPAFNVNIDSENGHSDTFCIFNVVR